MQGYVGLGEARNSEGGGLLLFAWQRRRLAAWVSLVKIEFAVVHYLSRVGLLVLTRSYKYLARWQLNQARVAVITLSYL